MQGIYELAGGYPGALFFYSGGFLGVFLFFWLLKGNIYSIPYIDQNWIRFLKAIGYLVYCRINTGVKEKLAQQTKSQPMCDYVPT